MAPELEQNMVELRALNARHLREINQLQNRVFVLETQIENQSKTDEPRRRRVWSVKLSSAPAWAPSPATPAGGGDPVPRNEAPPVIVPSSLAAEDATVEYAGEAALPARRNRVRPLLRLSGTGRPVVTYAEAATVEAATPVAVDPHQPLALYHKSMYALRAGHIAVALVGLRKFLARYPHHSYADNVQYAIGESYFRLDQYQSAVRELKRVVERYPHGNKVPDAMLKIGLAHLARGEGPEARQALETLCRIYPKHAITRLAKEKLATEHFARSEAHTSATASLDADRISSSPPR
jgi:tol-pal system protein YbgF